METEAKDAYNNYQQDDQGGNLNTTEFAEQEYKDFTQSQVTLAYVGIHSLSVKVYCCCYDCISEGISIYCVSYFAVKHWQCSATAAVALKHFQ